MEEFKNLFPCHIEILNDLLEAKKIARCVMVLYKQKNSLAKNAREFLISNGAGEGT